MFEKTTGVQGLSRKKPKIIVASNLKIGAFASKQLPNDYFHIKLDRIKKRITVLGYNNMIQSGTQNNGNSFQEGLTNFERRSEKEADIKLLIDRSNVKRVRIEERDRKMVIVFRQAIIYKYQAKMWRLQEVWNNSQMVLDIEKKNVSSIKKSKQRIPSSQHECSEYNFEFGIDHISEFDIQE